MWRVLLVFAMGPMVSHASLAGEPKTDDLDGDGFDSSVDCRDDLPEINPDAAEVCDGRDNNCDGQIDEVSSPDAVPYFRDADDDRFGSDSEMIWACALPIGYAEVAGDCDDNEPRAFPGNTELCDGVDNNCADGVDDDSALDILRWYFDNDGDGYGDEEVFQRSCDQPEPADSWVRAGGRFDCDDDKPHVLWCRKEGGRGVRVSCTQSAVSPPWPVLLLLTTLIRRRYNRRDTSSRCRSDA